jgi:hypothetical protein
MSSPKSRPQELQRAILESSSTDIQLIWPEPIIKVRSRALHRTSLRNHLRIKQKARQVIHGQSVVRLTFRCLRGSTENIEGEPLGRARAIEPEALLEALGVVTEKVPSTEACFDRFKSARLAIRILRTALARL